MKCATEEYNTLKYILNRFTIFTQLYNYITTIYKFHQGKLFLHLYYYTNFTKRNFFRLQRSCQSITCISGTLVCFLLCAFYFVTCPTLFCHCLVFYLAQAPNTGELFSFFSTQQKNMSQVFSTLLLLFQFLLLLNW